MAMASLIYWQTFEVTGSQGITGDSDTTAAMASTSTVVVTTENMDAEVTTGESLCGINWIMGPSLY